MSDIIFEEITGFDACLGVISLNRPNALNALNHNMVCDISKQLDIWENNPGISAIIVKSNIKKAFCAGGDIIKIYESGKADPEKALSFFRDEYKMIYKIHQLSKPFIAILDGIAMGGGLGLSLHASHVIGTEKLRMAMPEVGIGFFPDVGASCFLNNARGNFGLYMALTGSIVSVNQAKICHLISHQVSSLDVQQIITHLQDARLLINNPFITIDNIIKSFEDPSIDEDPSFIPFIAKYFNHHDTLSMIIEKLNMAGSLGEELVSLMQKHSPTSLAVTLEQLKRGRRLGFKENLNMEYNLAAAFLQKNDFYNGVYCKLIDKTQTVTWEPTTLNELNHADIMSYFATKRSLFEN